MTSTIASRLASDGTRLLTRHWAAVGDPWAAALLIHGLGEHSGRYDPVADALTAAGIDVEAYDQRGFGASGGRRAWIARWSDLHDDLEAMLADVRGRVPGPVILYGQSMGGLVVTGYVLDGRPLPDLLVLSAPAIDDDLPRWKHAAAAPLGIVAPRLRLANGIRRTDLAAAPLDPASYEEDPLVQTTTTARLGRFAFAEQARVGEALGQLDRMPVPTLVYRGADDPIVPARTVARFARLGDVTTRTYPGLRHETHNELDGGAVLDDVVTWIRERIMATETRPADAERGDPGGAAAGRAALIEPASTTTPVAAGESRVAEVPSGAPFDGSM